MTASQLCVALALSRARGGKDECSKQLPGWFNVSSRWQENNRAINRHQQDEWKKDKLARLRDCALESVTETVLVILSVCLENVNNPVVFSRNRSLVPDSKEAQ